MTNREIANVFVQIADLLEFQGANAFRIRAYRAGARRIADLLEPVSAISEDPDRALTDLDGIGQDLADKIETLLAGGSLPLLDELLAEIPASVLSLLRVPNLGPKKAATLYNELGVSTLDQLSAACESGEVEKLKGFGKKTAEKIIAGIDIAAHAEDRVYWKAADEIANAIKSHMATLKCVQELEFAGSYRRGKETVGDLDILVASKDAGRVMDRFGEFDPNAEVLVRGDTKMSIRLTSGLQVDLRVVSKESFGAALQYFTGSKEHNVVLRGMAKDRGLKINEWGVYRIEENAVEGEVGEKIAGESEDEIYEVLDLPCFPPELREARGEFDLAEDERIPKLIELPDIRGDLHMHTTASDGKATIEQMVAAAQERGLEYIAITDHSKRVAMANGLDGARLRAQWAEIDKLNAALQGDFIVLKGVECDILENGDMDIPDDVLAEADWVNASIHYGQSQSREQITDRILGAIANPNVTMISHPTGRLINRREPYAVDMDAVIRAAAAQGTYLELNANPARLDLHDIHCAIAKRHGVKIVINTDAHRPDQLDNMRCGVLQARRGGLTADDVLNTRSWPF